ncbi:uncharacterized protein LOC107868861 [Capsicum annuum]|uniref:uncharacterized protein LOC107868861 n=1 Tax=Capsicum annuum TaxID=4072 RepID=UPI0007BF1DEB|nr:uncharacterized protein LOC107868861 [Capsicum annuum]
MIANPNNNAQVPKIVIRSGKTLDKPSKRELIQKMPKVKEKEVLPQSLERNDEKKADESDKEVVGIKKAHNEERLTIQVRPLFPQQFYKKSDKLRKFMAKLSNLSINISFLETIQEILGYAKLMKQLMSRMKIIEGETIEFTHGCSIIMDNKVVEKKNDPGAFTIPCTIGTHESTKAQYDLGASINLVPFINYKKLRLDSPTPRRCDF